jgi:glutamine---fructose-6-phosphate transaminase (isomerizing)
MKAKPTQFVTYREITSQGEALREVLSRWNPFPDELGKYQQYVFTGCGSSLYLGSLVAQVWNCRAGRSSRAIPASEMILRPEFCFARSVPTAVFGVSRSGETPETEKALRVAREQHGLYTVAVTCYPEASMGSLAAGSLFFPEVREEGMVTTRAFTVVASALLDWAGLGKDVRKLPAFIEQSLGENTESVRELASQPFDQAVFLGTGPLLPIAHESALKFKEMTGTPASGMQTFEFRHGHQASLGRGSLVWLFVCREDVPYLGEVIPEFRNLGAEVVVAGANLPAQLQNDASRAFNLTWPLGMTESEAVGLIHLTQLLAFFRALSLGRNPDRPERLARVVRLGV